MVILVERNGDHRHYYLPLVDIYFLKIKEACWDASRSCKLTQWASRTQHKCFVLVVSLSAASTAAVSFPVPELASVLSGRARMALSRHLRYLAPLFRKQVIVWACNGLAGTDSDPADQSPKNVLIFLV